jgi:hypothetical protein
MIKQSTEQTLTLTGLDQGHRYALVITGAQSDVLLQFKHAQDPTWYDMPTTVFDGAVSGSDPMLGEFFCFTPTMRITFADAPSQPYYVSCICAATARF